jgi:hypothetical protein
MNLATITPAEVESVRTLSSLALQYGPFFFSIIFILFVPIIGQKWFFRMLHTRVPGGSEVRDAAMRVYKFYWISGIVAGLALVGVSVIWWGYVQYTFNTENFNKKLSQEINRRVFQGIIYGADDNDMFIYQFDNPQYSVYIFPQRNQTPMLVRYAVIFSKDAEKDEKIHILYMNKKTYKILLESTINGEAIGYKPTPLEFCITDTPADMTLIKDKDKPPHFDNACDGKNS